MIPIRWPAANTKSSGNVGHVKRYSLPISTGVAALASSESRFEESRMPFETRHWVTLIAGFSTIL